MIVSTIINIIFIRINKYFHLLFFNQEESIRKKPRTVYIHVKDGTDVIESTSLYVKKKKKMSLTLFRFLSFSILLRFSLFFSFLFLTLIIAPPKPVRFICGRSAKRRVARAGPARCRSRARLESGVLVIVGASLSGPR